MSSSGEGRGAGPLAGLSRKWAGVTRHRRLRFAILGCLFVMFSLVVALVAAVRFMDDNSGSMLQAAQQHAAVSSDLTEVAEVLRRYEAGSTTAIERLTELHADLSQREGLFRGAVTIDPGELQALLDQAATIIDADRGSGSALTFVLGTAGGFERLANEFGTASEAETKSAVGNLSRWFSWMQTVAVVSAFVFMVVVATAILPLIRSIERSLAKLQTWRERSARDVDRRTLAAQVTDGLEVSETESRAYAVIERAVSVAAPSMKVELLLADSSNAHLRPVVEHPENGAAGCGVVSPWSCPAVRRGAAMVFDDSKAIRSCPHLADHGEPCSAVCAPLTFMGEPLGVLHATGPVGVPPARDLVEDLTLVAAESATRLGTLRAIARAELQASTDVLTGLPNRRATDDRLRELMASVDVGAVALIEIDGILALNDQLGKAAGDRALKVAAESLQFSSREIDFVGRWAGAEFVALFQGHTSVSAREMAVRLHDDLIESFGRADLQGLDVQIGIADTRLAETSRDVLQLANDALGESRAVGEWKARRSNVPALPKRVR